MCFSSTFCRCFLFKVYLCEDLRPFQFDLQKGRAMAQQFANVLRASFSRAVGGDDPDAVLTSPGVSGLVVMFAGMVVDTHIQKVFDEQEWSAERSFTFSELMDLASHLGIERGDAGELQERQETDALERIVGRINSGSSLLLTPEDVPEGSTRDVGEWAQMFALRSEYSMLQAFVDQEFARYMER